MKILHAHKYYYARAGAERYMLDLMKMQEETGHIVAPFAMHYEQNMASPWSEYFVSELKTQRVGRGWGAIKQAVRALWSFEAGRKIGKMCDVFQPDVIHIHNIYTHFSPSILRACKKRGIPIVMTVHDHALLSANHAAWSGTRPLSVKEMKPFSVAKTRFIKGSYVATLVLALIHEWHLFSGAYDKNINRYLAVSKYMKSAMVERGFPKEKIQVLYNFVDPECVPRKKRTSGVFFLGRLEDYKGVQTLIKAMKQLPDIYLRIAGSGSYERILRKQSKGMKNIKFLGHLNKKEIGEEFASVRAAVFPSLLNEPFGLSAVEAMACSVPVIVSNRGGLAEVVEDGISGRIFEAGNVDDLVGTLKDFLHSEPYANSMGEAAAIRADNIANPQEHLEKVLKVYKELI